MSKNRRSTKWSREDVLLKAWHHFKLKIKQALCLHGDYSYLELTTQRTPDSGKVITFARGCRKCGWINTAMPYDGMPRTMRNSYDRTYLKITSKDDRLLSDIEAEKKKTERQRKFDERKKVGGHD